jgi:hypothetical protein
MIGSIMKPSKLSIKRLLLNQELELRLNNKGVISAKDFDNNQEVLFL